MVHYEVRGWRITRSGDGALRYEGEVRKYYVRVDGVALVHVHHCGSLRTRNQISIMRSFDK
jgi:hypothetical protein